MTARRVLLVLLVSGALARAAGAAPWHAVVEGPRGLPSVDVSAGYSDGYVSAASSPITLRIRTGDRGFDGYIGFHIAVGTRRTLDTPVVTPVSLAPRAEQIFSTWASTRSSSTAPEIVVEWLNGRMEVIGRKSAGVPPWQPAQSLRIGTIPVASLGTQAQWYAGFTNAIVPLDLWFELPMPVREAIFRSAVHVLFVGPPSRMPRMTAFDQALLPIDVRQEPAELEVPWPYGNAKKNVPLSWTAKAGTQVVGSPRLPYIVTNSIATFVAGEDALRLMPAFKTTFARSREYYTRPVTRTPRFAEIFRVLRPPLLGLLLLALPFVAWFLLRRRPRLVTGLFMCAVAVILVVARQSLRVATGREDVRILRIETPGVFEVNRAASDWGATPMNASAGTTDSVTQGIFNLGVREVRTSATSPGFGAVWSRASWDTAKRVVKRRELGTPSRISVRPSGRDALIVSYDGTVAADYVSAEWLCGRQRCAGTAVAGGKRRGEVIVRNGVETWSCLECPFGSLVWPQHGGAGLVSLISNRSDAATWIMQVDPPGSSTPARPPYSIRSGLERDEQGLVAAFAIPPPNGDENVSLSLIGIGAFGNGLSRITLAGEAGEVTIAVDQTGTQLRRIAPRGGIVVARIRTSVPAKTTESWTARLSVDERKP